MVLNYTRRWRIKQYVTKPQVQTLSVVFTTLLYYAFFYYNVRVIMNDTHRRTCGLLMFIFEWRTNGSRHLRRTEIPLQLNCRVFLLANKMMC